MSSASVEPATPFQSIWSITTEITAVSTSIAATSLISVARVMRRGFYAACSAGSA